MESLALIRHTIVSNLGGFGSGRVGKSGLENDALSTKTTVSAAEPALPSALTTQRSMMTGPAD